MPHPWPARKHRRCSPCRAGRSRSPAWHGSVQVGSAPDPDSSWHSRAPSRPGRRRDYLEAGPCRGSRSSPYFGELGVGPLAEPGLVLAPAQSLLEEDLVDAAALHGDAPVLVQVRGQSVQRPRRKGQAERSWRRERGGDHGGDLLGRIGGGPSGAAAVFEAVEPLGIEAVDPAADGVDFGTDELGDVWGAAALAGVVDDTRALDLTRGRGAGVGEFVDPGLFLGAQFAQANGGHHGTPPDSAIHYSHPSSRMNHLDCLAVMTLSALSTRELQARRGIVIAPWASWGLCHLRRQVPQEAALAQIIDDDATNCIGPRWSRLRL